MFNMIRKYAVFAGLFGATALMASCGGKGAAAQGDDADSVSVSVPAFSADSAYSGVAAQLALGPRVPGTAAHAQCVEMIVSRMRKAGADSVWVQHGVMADAANNPVKISNIIARFNATAPKRLLLMAHYDTRPWADEDADASNHDKPIPGANDGASGVGVLMEIGRLLGMQKPDVGVDLLFVDAEDMGVSDDDDPSSDLTWCLGTQFFVNNMPYSPADRPEAAVLLDMVGGRGARFPYEYFSYRGARQLAERIWNTADGCGEGERFEKRVAGAVNDDHVHTLGAGIPTVDIIEIGHAQTGSFNPTWHTMNDNMDNIDASTLGAVGKVVTAFIYNY